MPRSGGRRNSFSPETPVWTPDGQVPIGEVVAGDAVLGYNEATGTTGTYTVTGVWKHEDPLVVALTIDDEVITATLEHPFYVMLRGWVAAENLRPGQAIRRADGSYGLVRAVAQVAEHQPMVNLSVAEAHTFFVGDDGWLVFVYSPSPPPPEALLQLGGGQMHQQRPAMRAGARLVASVKLHQQAA
jgi:hypothetical protein